jgi:prevent-host-death family protein
VNVTSRDLRFKIKELLERVGKGEEVVVTFRGKPCARLVPYRNPEKKSRKTALFGIWKDHEATADVAGYVRNLRKGRF